MIHPAAHFQIGQENPGKALQNLHTLAIELEHVFDRVAVELQVGTAGVLNFEARSVGESKRIDGPQKQGFAPEPDICINNFFIIYWYY